MACGKVVGAVQYHICLRYQCIEQRIVCALGHSAHLHIRVDASNGTLNRFGLEQAHTGQRVGDLPLQIGDIYPVVVDHRQVANACAAQVKRHR